eukprot:jgi/Mesvir1/5392/Mv15467-RA.1
MASDRNEHRNDDNNCHHTTQMAATVSGHLHKPRVTSIQMMRGCMAAPSLNVATLPRITVHGQCHLASSRATDYFSDCARCDNMLYHDNSCLSRLPNFSRAHTNNEFFSFHSFPSFNLILGMVSPEGSSSTPEMVTELVAATTEFLARSSPSDEAFGQFLLANPIESILGVLQQGDVPPDAERVLLAFLGKLFNVFMGGALLLGSLIHAVQGLQASSSGVQRFILEQVSRAVALGDMGLDAVAHTEGLLPAVGHCLANRDTGVAEAASSLLLAVATSAQGWEALKAQRVIDRLTQLMESNNATVRLRALSLCMRLSRVVRSRSLENDVFRRVVADLANTGDVLASMLAMDSLVQLAADSGGLALYADSSNAADLISRVAGLMRSDNADRLLRGQAVRVAAQLIASTDASAGGSSSSSLSPSSLATPMNVGGERGDDRAGPGCQGYDAPPPGGQVPARVQELADACLACARSCEERGELQLLETVLAAVGTAAAGVHGAELMLSHGLDCIKYMAQVAFTRGGGDRQLAALHSLGRALGAERMPEPLLASAPSEERLRDVLLEAAAASSFGSLPEFFSKVLSQPFPEMHAAAYTLIRPLGVRAWAAVQMCMHAPLLALLTDARSETQKRACEMRHECVQALLQGVSGQVLPNSPTVAPAIMQQLHESIRKGPFGRLQGQEAIPTVATMNR